MRAKLNIALASPDTGLRESTNLRCRLRTRACQKARLMLDHPAQRKLTPKLNCIELKFICSFSEFRKNRRKATKLSSFHTEVILSFKFTSVSSSPVKVSNYLETKAHRINKQGGQSVQDPLFDACSNGKLQA